LSSPASPPPSPRYGRLRLNTRKRFGLSKSTDSLPHPPLGSRRQRQMGGFGSRGLHQPFSQPRREARRARRRSGFGAAEREAVSKAASLGVRGSSSSGGAGGRGPLPDCLGRPLSWPPRPNRRTLEDAHRCRNLRVSSHTSSNDGSTRVPRASATRARGAARRGSSAGSWGREPWRSQSASQLEPSWIGRRSRTRATGGAAKTRQRVIGRVPVGPQLATAPRPHRGGKKRPNALTLGHQSRGHPPSEALPSPGYSLEEPSLRPPREVND
jgi:hypothetical protein